MSYIEMNTLAQQAVIEFLNENLTREDLEDILRNRKIGWYGRLRKHEMAQAIAGVHAQEVFDTERERNRTYRQRRKAVDLQHIPTTV